MANVAYSLDILIIYFFLYLFCYLQHMLEKQVKSFQKHATPLCVTT